MDRGTCKKSIGPNNHMIVQRILCIIWYVVLWDKLSISWTLTLTLTIKNPEYSLPKVGQPTTWTALVHQTSKSKTSCKHASFSISLLFYINAVNRAYLDQALHRKFAQCKYWEKKNLMITEFSCRMSYLSIVSVWPWAWGAWGWALLLTRLPWNL